VGKPLADRNVFIPGSVLLWFQPSSLKGAL